MKKYSECLKYINNYWKKITFYHPKDERLSIGLPHPFVAPNAEMFKKIQFYWDSYFIILGLIEAQKISLAKGMVDNLIYLFKRFGKIPSGSNFPFLAISQIPFLTSKILEIFHITKNKKWLRETSIVAESELKNYWMNKEHLAYKNLSRYCDKFWTHEVSEHESGWDCTSRFSGRCLDYLPVDLNCCLYKYEKDLSEIYKILNNRKKRNYYLKASERRKKTIIELMWNEKNGFFFDYNWKLKRQSNFYSLAGFFPLWVKMVTLSQAEKMRKNLKKFEQKGGLANTQKHNLFKEFRQWDYPNGWPNLQWIVIKGLLNYKFEKDAERIAKKWLDMVKKVFLKTGRFWEKYDVVKCDVGKEGRYPTESGFGWTNALFLKIVKEFKFI